MKRTKAYLMLSLTALLVLALAACADRDRAAAPQAEREGEPTAPMTGEQPGTTPYQQGAAITGADRDFLTQQLQSNMAEQELARMAEQRASREEVRDYARQLREDHERAAQELRRIANQGQVTVPTEMDAQNRQTVDRLRGLSGQQFDREFLQHAVQSHQQKIQRYQQISQQAGNPEVRNFASSELPRLQQHLQRAQELHRGSASGADRTGTRGTMGEPGTQQPRY